MASGKSPVWLLSYVYDIRRKIEEIHLSWQQKLLVRPTLYVRKEKVFGKHLMNLRLFAFARSWTKSMRCRTYWRCVQLYQLGGVFRQCDAAKVIASNRLNLRQHVHKRLFVRLILGGHRVFIFPASSELLHGVLLS